MLIFINDKPYELTEADEGKTILEVCRDNGIEIPTLCHHPLLEPFTSCYLCIVKIEGRGDRYFPSCGTKVEDGMRITTEDEDIRATRKTNLELILSNHEADCYSPCQNSCPAEIDIQSQLSLIRNKRYTDAVKITRDAVPFPATLGRVCPSPCESACRRQEIDDPLAICSIKRFLGDMEIDHKNFLPETGPRTGRKVAIVGAGPAGLSAAYYLAIKGHEVVIYEQMPKAGGMLRYGIPYYRLPEEVLDAEIADILSYPSISIRYNKKIGRDVHFQRLREEYDAVMLAMGCWAPSPARFSGEEHCTDGIQFLREVAEGKEVKVGKRVGVVGGGNTAIDSARTSLRMGAEVKVLYRRTKSEMPANAHEIFEAEEERIDFHYLTSPVSVEKVGNHLKVKCQKMALGEPDASGRRRPVPIEGRFEEFELDTLILAVGQTTSSDLVKMLKESIPMTSWGTVEVSEKGFTGKENVFAAGDISMGPGLVVEAVATGRHTAEAIDQFVRGEPFPEVHGIMATRQKMTENYLVSFDGITQIPRFQQRFSPASERVKGFGEYAKPMTELDVQSEVERCMTCGCYKVDTCNVRLYADDLGANQERFRGESIDYTVDMSHPYIGMDPSRCINCGLCVRFCDELRGVSVFAFTDRGFGARIAAEYYKPLNETKCISCGDCIAVCPTGTLFSKTPSSVPLPHFNQVTKSTCQYCGLNCELQLQHMYGNIAWVNGDQSAHNNEHLCMYGRFFHDHTMKINPYFNQQEALDQAKEVAQTLVASPDLQIFASPSFTTEELSLVQLLAQELGAPVTSFSGLTQPIHEVVNQLEFSNKKFGIVGYRPAHFENLKNAGLIILAGVDTNQHNAVIDPLLRHAQRGGTMIMALGDTNFTTPKDSHLPGPLNVVCASVCRYLVEKNAVGEYATEMDGWDEFQKKFTEVGTMEIPDDAKAILQEHTKRYVVIVGTEETAHCTQQLSIMLGQENPVKMLLLRAHGNTVTFGDLFKDKEPLANPRSALVIGENPGYYDVLHPFLKSLEKLVVIDTIETETSKMGQFVQIMPPQFTDGHLYSLQRGVVAVRSVRPNLGRYNREFLSQLVTEVAKLKGRENIEIPEPTLNRNVVVPEVELSSKHHTHPCHEFDSLKLYHKRVHDKHRKHDVALTVEMATD